MGHFKIGKYLTLLIAFIMIGGNVIVVHFLSPIGLLLSPILVILSISLIDINSSVSNIYLKAISTAILIAINDIGIKLYSKGIHDSEGQGVLNLLFLIEVVSCFLILIFGVYKTNEMSVLNKLISLLIFLLLIGLHVYLFSDFGLTQF